MCCCVCKLESNIPLTWAEHDELLEMMQRGGHHIHLSEQTRHLVIQKLLIDHVYCQRSRQIDAIAVSSIAVLLYITGRDK